MVEIIKILKNNSASVRQLDVFMKKEKKNQNVADAIFPLLNTRCYFDQITVDCLLREKDKVSIGKVQLILTLTLTLILIQTKINSKWRH